MPLHFTNAEKSPGVKDQGGVVSHVLNEIDITCFPDDLPEFVEVDLGNLAVGNSIHARDLKLPKGVELALKDENPVVATVVVPQLVTEEEEAAAAAAAVAPSEIPTTEQAEPKEGEAAEGEAAKGGDKPAAEGRQGCRQGRERQEVNRREIGWLLAWATRARSTSARATTPASGWWSASRRRTASCCARTRSSRRSSESTPTAWLLLPQSFMNLSGQPVQMLAGFFGSSPRKCWWCTTSDFPPGTVRSSRAAALPGTTAEGHLAAPRHA